MNNLDAAPYLESLNAASSPATVKSCRERLAEFGIRLLKRLLGKARALAALKAVTRRLPERYAFAVTWICLREFPFESVPVADWQNGRLRSFRRVQVCVNPKCLHARFFVMAGYYEAELTKHILAPERTGLLVDVGANYGYYGMLWLQKSPDTRLIAVEPVAEYVSLLRQNFLRYSARGRIFDGCIGDHDGDALLDTVGEPTMLSHVVTDNSGGTARHVPMLTLPSLLTRFQETTIDVLKVDAEGYDLTILETCKPLFTAGAIRTVFWEVSSAAGHEPFQQFLKSVGYRSILTGHIAGYQLEPRGNQ